MADFFIRGVLIFGVRVAFESRSEAQPPLFIVDNPVCKFWRTHRRSWRVTKRLPTPAYPPFAQVNTLLEKLGLPDGSPFPPDCFRVPYCINTACPYFLSAPCLDNMRSFLFGMDVGMYPFFCTVFDFFPFPANLPGCCVDDGRLGFSHWTPSRPLRARSSRLPPGFFPFFAFEQELRQGSSALGFPNRLYTIVSPPFFLGSAFSHYTYR